MASTARWVDAVTPGAAGPLLELSGITKRYPGSVANDGVSLRIGHNEIHALLGENGAGKSTLVRIAYGLTRPDAGTIAWQGQPVRIAGPADARRLGIGVVFQHFALFEALTVADNILLGLDDRRDRARVRETIGRVSETYGLPVDPDRVVHDLSAGERQRVEVVRCLLRQPKLLILDEPTSVLTAAEADQLFVTLRRLAREGCSVLYISHKLEEVRALCDTATILRRGRVAGTLVPSAHTARALAEAMIGTTLPPAARSAPCAASAPVRLAVDRLTLRARRPAGTGLRAVTLSVRGGEILGIAGIAGNGQAELMAALSGETLAGRPETVLVDGVPAGHMGPRERRRLGCCFVPEDRHGHGAVPSMSLADNAFLSAHRRRRLSRFGMIRRDRTAAYADAIIAGFDVRAAGAGARAGSLSGGNLQKFLVGREVMLDPAVLVIDQPTWGVDARAAAAIHAAIVARVRAGAAALVISQDLTELLALCDRVAVLAGGALCDARPAASLSPELVGRLMAGGDALPLAAVA